jgi:hypothetical protein
LNPEIRAQQFKWAQPTKVEARPSDPALSFSAKAKPFENPVLTVLHCYNKLIGYASFDGSSGFWDKGWSGILQFLKEHNCNKICRKLGLNVEAVVVSASLSDGAVPQTEELSAIKPHNLHRQ